MSIISPTLPAAFCAANIEEIKERIAEASKSHTKNVVPECFWEEEEEEEEKGKAAFIFKRDYYKLDKTHTIYFYKNIRKCSKNFDHERFIVYLLLRKT